MPPSPPAVVWPVSEEFWRIGRETVAPATAATSYLSVASAPFAPDNKPTWLDDDANRGSNVKVYDTQQGPIWAEHSVPESPLFGDTFGAMLFGLMGDYWSSGTAATPTWTASGAISPGAGPVTVTSGSLAVAGTLVQIEASGTTTEVVKVGTGSTATSIVIDASTPIRFSHLTAVTITTVVAPFTHNFSTLNLNSSTGSNSGQPPSYTVQHRNGLAGSGGFFADQFLYGKFSEIKVTGKKSGWLVWEGKLTSYSQSAVAAVVTPAFSSVRAIPTWKSTTTIASTAAYQIEEWSCTMTREMDVVNTGDGVQNPYGIFQGPVTTKFDLAYNAVSDQTALNYMLNNTQPTLQYSISNGGSGASLVSFAANAQLAAYKTSTLKAMKTLYGYQASGEFIASTTNAGNSGGYSPVQFTLVNAIPTY